MSGGMLGGIGKIAGGLLGSATSVVGGAKYWLIAMVVASGVAYGTGYYRGNDHVTTKVVNASFEQVKNATAAGASGQAKKDAEDFRQARRDYDARLKKQHDADMALVAILQNKLALVPHNSVCLVRGASMDVLNSTSLIGESQ